MIFNRPLTDEERRRAQINYNRYSLVNGASYVCLGETVVILFALKLHAPNVLIAVVGSMIYFGYLLLPLGVLRTGCVGAARSQADFWVWRNLAALLAASGAVAALFSEHLAWGLLLAGSFLFYGFRAAGVVMAQPLLGDITTDADRAKLLGESSARFYILSVITLAAITFIVGWCDNIWVLTAIIATGALTGIAASTFVRRIDETSAIRDTARKPLLPQLRSALADRSLRKQIYAGAVFNLGNIMLAPISVMALKRGCGVSDRAAILFSLLQFGAAAFGSKLTEPVTRRIGTRGLAVLTYLLIFPVCLFWILGPAPGASLPARCMLGVPFLLLGIYIASYNNAMIGYFLISVPKERQVAGSMFINILTGVAASLVSMLAAGTLLKFSEHFFGSGLPMFRAYFASAGGIFLLSFLLILRLDSFKGK